MSDSQTYEEISVSADGVTVAKSFEADAFPVPAIAFRIASERTRDVEVRLVDSVPDGVDVEDLGFHPEYGSEYWSIQEDEIVFEREIEAGEQYTTVYGIRATGTDDVQQFLTEPRIEEVDPPLGEDEAIVGGGSQVVRDVISGDADSVPGLDDDEEDIGTLDLADPNDAGDDDGGMLGGSAPGDAGETEAESGGEAGAEGEDEGGEAEDDDQEGPSVEGVVKALAEEIEMTDVEEEYLDTLRSEIGADGAAAGGTGSLEARIEHLQNEVSEVLAYSEALEEFLDENGTAQQTIEGFREDLADVESRLDEIGDEIDASMDEVRADVEAQVDDVRGDVGDNAEEISALSESLEGVEEDVEELVSDVQSIDREVDSIGRDVNDLNDRIDELDDFDERLADLEDELDRAAEDDRIEDVEDDVEDVRGEIEDLKEWREQLSSVLGAGGG